MGWNLGSGTGLVGHRCSVGAVQKTGNCACPARAWMGQGLAETWCTLMKEARCPAIISWLAVRTLSKGSAEVSQDP